MWQIVFGSVLSLCSIYANEGTKYILAKRRARYELASALGILRISMMTVPLGRDDALLKKIAENYQFYYRCPILKSAYVQYMKYYLSWMGGIYKDVDLRSNDLAEIERIEKSVFLAISENPVQSIVGRFRPFLS
jgi:hypothetical protein